METVLHYIFVARCLLQHLKMAFIPSEEISENTESKDLHICRISNVHHGALIAVLFTHVTASLDYTPETLTKGE